MNDEIKGTSNLSAYVFEEIDELAEALAMHTHKTKREIKAELVKVIDNLDIR